MKGYYPGNFGTGITVGQEPAHVFINFNVASLTNWTADVTLVYQTRYNGVLYPKGHIETSINADGVVSRYMRVPPPYTENGDIATRSTTSTRAGTRMTVPGRGSCGARTSACGQPPTQF